MIEQLIIVRHGETEESATGVAQGWLHGTLSELGIGAVAIYTLRQPRIYEVAASVIIDANPPRFLDSQVQEVVETGTGSYWYNKEYYETQYKVIVSRAVSQHVVDKLGLAHDASFLGVDRVKDPEKRRLAMEAADAAALVDCQSGSIEV